MRKALSMRYIISLLLTSAALPAMAEVPRVVTDLPAVHSLVAQVMGDLGQPQLLLDKGANGHSFQLRPSQAAELQEAGLVVWIGPEMTPWLDRALEGITGATQLRLLAAEGTYLQEFGATGGHAHSEEGHDEHGHEEHGHEEHGHEEAKAEEGHDAQGHEDHAAEDNGDDHAGHDHTGLDPHAWLDPANASHWLGLIAAELSRLDPDNAATYAANAATATESITALDAELATTLAPVKDRPLVVFHDAYGYFAAHYGLNIAASIAMGDAAAPGAKHIAEVQEILTKGPTCLLPEANHDDKLVVELAAATGAVLGAPLDPEGSTFDPGPTVYGDLMRSLAKSLATCAKG